MRGELDSLQQAVKSQIDATLKESESVMRASQKEEGNRMIKDLEQKLASKRKQI